MRAVELQAIGGPEQLVLTERAEPVPGPRDILVRVRAAGLNFADVMMRQGRYTRQPQLPAVIGIEVAGEVAATGPEVKGFQVGQRVMGVTTAGGGYAELALSRPAGLLPIPDNLSFVEAAAVPVVFLTACHCLTTFGRVAAGERVLIHAAAGGVGTAAVQWAKALGAEVYATASSDAKLDRVAALGADVCINYAQTDFAAAVRERTDGEGVDVVLESVGGKVLENSLGLLRQLGRLVVFGRSAGQSISLDPWQLVSRNVSIAAFSLSTLRTGASEAAQAVHDLLGSGKAKPVVGHVLPLAEIREAHRLLESRESFGKVVVTL